QVPHHLGHLVDVARLQLLDMVLEAPGPVRRHARFLLAQHCEDLLDLFVVDDFAQADLLGVVGRDHQGEVTVRKPEDEILTVRPEDIALLPALDDGSAVMGVDNFVSDVKRHSSPKGGTAVGTSPECHRIAGWANLTTRSGGGERDAGMVDMSMLSTTRLFQGLPPDAVAAVAAGSSVRRLRRHDVVFEEGDLASELFLVQEGLIAIANKSSDGRESVVALMEPGDLFGEISLFDGLGRSAAARALDDSSVLAVQYDDVRRTFDADPTL